jgi:hypothetical protein
MAKHTIDQFPFLTQWKAQASPGPIPKDSLAIWADYGLRREIKEDI